MIFSNHLSVQRTLGTMCLWKGGRGRKKWNRNVSPMRKADSSHLAHCRTWPLTCLSEEKALNYLSQRIQGPLIMLKSESRWVKEQPWGDKVNLFSFLLLGDSKICGKNRDSLRPMSWVSECLAALIWNGSVVPWLESESWELTQKMTVPFFFFSTKMFCWHPLPTKPFASQRFECGGGHSTTWHGAKTCPQTPELWGRKYVKDPDENTLPVYCLLSSCISLEAAKLANVRTGHWLNCLMSCLGESWHSDFPNT